jgi:hypothetical protein
VSDATFSGTIAGVRHLGFPPVEEVIATNPRIGPMRLHLRFPKGRGGPGEPLVSTGVPGAGDIFYVTYLGGNSIRFGLENSGDILTTEPLTVNLDADHLIDLEMGSLYPPADIFPQIPAAEAARIRKRYSVRIDGRLLIMALRNFQPSRADQVVCGLNTIHASTAEGAFTGTITAIERIKLPPPRAAHSWGPVDAWVVLPRDRTGLAEPLVTTGVAGKGDVVFARYEDQGHVRIGFDHWSVGGPMSQSVAVDFSRPHHLELRMGSLFPPAGDPAWTGHFTSGQDAKARIQVRLDGAVLLDADLPTFDTSAERLAFWSNPIGASSCRETFTGEVVESLAPTW